MLIYLLSIGNLIGAARISLATVEVCLRRISLTGLLHRCVSFRTDIIFLYIFGFANLPVFL